MRAQLFAFAAVFLSLAAVANEELAIAKQALRDGVWSVAREHALRSSVEEGRLVALESYARESRWQDMLTTLAAWGNPEGEGFVCYRAMALTKTGEGVAARKLLEGVDFSDSAMAMMAAKIRAEIFLQSDEPAEALKALEVVDRDDVDSKMLKAKALLATGAKNEAEIIWRDVAASTNASEEAVASAASRLDDAELLRKAYERMQTATLRRSVGIRLGVTLMHDKATFDEGAKLVMAIVRDAPDTDGAKEGFLALADGLLDRKSWASAADVYDEILETWPEIAKDPSFHEGRGWALSELGKHEAALDAFNRAAELASDDATKSMALVKAGDMLAVLGRGAEAMSRYRMVRDEFPKTLAAERIANLVRLQELEEKGRVQYGEYRFSDAQRTFEQVAEEDSSRRAKMAYYVVMCLYGQGRDEEAESKAKNIASNESFDNSVKAQATFWLAKYYYNRGRWKDSAARFLAYASLVPESSSAPVAIVWSARASFADNDFARAVSTATKLADMKADDTVRAAGLLVQGEALIELARFDEAVLVLERAALAAGMASKERFQAQLLKADALFAMGADNPVRYIAALDAYRTLQLGADLEPSQKISIAFKIGKTLERLKRLDEAIDQYYTQVVIAYSNGREKGLRYTDEAHAAFSRAAFRLAEEYESRGQDYQAVNMLSIVVASKVPAADEAARRIDRIRKKGRYL